MWYTAGLISALVPFQWVEGSGPPSSAGCQGLLWVETLRDEEPCKGLLGVVMGNSVRPAIAITFHASLPATLPGSQHPHACTAVCLLFLTLGTSCRARLPPALRNWRQEASLQLQHTAQSASQLLASRSGHC